ncbi:thioredoxin-like 3-3 [Rhodamnia argentea]|uniref:Thioredoxin-like 3-3 n=1 Tax=Rhodamnia argentea TaxID=178133 RepID=A0A8B8NIV7_9MYRT|nr:thioredoxin-like 3-3 [Rhodamnia argentea]
MHQIICPLLHSESPIVGGPIDDRVGKHRTPNILKHGTLEPDDGLTLPISRARGSPSKEVGMEGPSSGKEDGASKMLGDAAVSEMPVNRHGNMRVASSDPDLSQIMKEIKSSKSPAAINYGASWCHVCSQILPAFCQLSNSFQKLSFVYADIDECPETTQHIRYTPTFHFYRDGERVDEMFGAGEERLHDRLWLHS